MSRCFQSEIHPENDSVHSKTTSRSLLLNQQALQRTKHTNYLKVPDNFEKHFDRCLTHQSLNTRFLSSDELAGSAEHCTFFPQHTEQIPLSSLQTLFHYFVFHFTTARTNFLAMYIKMKNVERQFSAGWNVIQNLQENSSQHLHITQIYVCSGMNSRSWAIKRWKCL